VPRTAAADSIIGVTYFDKIAPDEFAEFDKAFICLLQVVSGNTWIDSLPTHSPEGSVNFGNVSLKFTYSSTITFLKILLLWACNSKLCCSRSPEYAKYSATVDLLVWVCRSFS
jgi:hypothetical protein